jgi:NAD(P)H-dependent flavin oxidoreductase YrpB (nitropropane dioxygenase family)
MRAILNEGMRSAGDQRAPSVRSETSIGTTLLHGERIPLPQFSAILPTRDFDGDIGQTCLTAGQSVGNIDQVMPAAEIMRRMTEEAAEVLKRFEERAIAIVP